ncbi:MAG: V-type ATP synthase subunit F [bacterium]
MHKIKFIAPKYLIAPLAILGIETYPAETEGEASNQLAAIAQKREPALIFITERLATYLKEEIGKLIKKPDINVVLIPDNRGSTNMAAEEISRLVKNSIGAEVVIRQ